MRPLTEKQRAILEFLERQQREVGVPPSTREVQREFGFASQTAVLDHLQALERKGFLERIPGKARAIRLYPGTDRAPVLDIPLYGSIAAGMANDAPTETNGCISVDVTSLGLPSNARTFALRVRGDSMTGAHIMDGDVVIMEFREPREGDIVAALIDGETTLKRYTVRGRKPFLRAENPAYPDLIPARELVVQGVLVALLRTVKRG